MTLLSDADIKREIEVGFFKITPYDDTLIQPASIDVRLDRTFLMFSEPPTGVIDPATRNTPMQQYVCENDDWSFVLESGELVLASTFEHFEIPADIAGRCEGKSSLGRLGLEIHSTAGFIDPGFKGHITLELSNSNRWPIRLWPGMLIAQLCLYRMSSTVTNPYGSRRTGSHYQNQTATPGSSKSHVNFRRGLDNVITNNHIDWGMQDGNG